MSGKLSRLGTVLLAMGILGGCATGSSTGTGASSATSAGMAAETATTTSTAASPPTTSEIPQPSDGTDINLEPRLGRQIDWSFNIDDPAAVADFSRAVVSGVIVHTEGSNVGPLEIIHTNYTLKVDKVYKGDLKVGDEINVSLAGGTMTLGDYIAELDRLGKYDGVFPTKDEKFMKDAGIDPTTVVDPRDADPNTPVTHNFGTNPTSKSLNEEITPDAWVYFLNSEDDGTYYGSVFDHSLKYVKDGYVYSLDPEPLEGQTPTPFSEAELGK